MGRVACEGSSGGSRIGLSTRWGCGRRGCALSSRCLALDQVVGSRGVDESVRQGAGLHQEWHDLIFVVQVVSVAQESVFTDVLAVV